ncbi:MAG: hypothetical protein LQ351_004700 [Letrouitia transgressa]|nr:MAG: hypothetical protein LQ351_004700 [Letrouitia transgressa]
MPLGFLSLPAEIRDQIYHELLSSDNARVSAASDHLADSYHFDLSILRTNKLIHHEAKKAFQDNIVLKITTPWPESIDHISSEGRVPIVASGPHADSFSAFHLGIYIDTYHPYTDRGTYSMLILLDDLPAFTRMWHFSNLNHYGLNSNLKLKLVLQDPYVPTRKIPKTLQNAFLLPFGLVKGLPEFAIEYPLLLPSVKEALRIEQETKDPSAEECLESASSLKEQGNKHLHAGDYTLALEFYVSAFAAIHITVKGRTRIVHADGYYIRHLISGPNRGERGDLRRMILRVQLVANTVLAYLKQKNMDEAYFWGKRSIMLYRRSMTGDGTEEFPFKKSVKDDLQWLKDGVQQNHPFPAMAELGKIFYRTGLAARAMDKRNEGSYYIRAAAVLLPTDILVQGEKEKVEKEMEEQKAKQPPRRYW